MGLLMIILETVWPLRVTQLWWEPTGDDDNGTSSGSAYVFTRTGTTWTEQAKLTASDGAADDYFGSSVAIAGDTIVVGAYADDDNGDQQWQCLHLCSELAMDDEVGFRVAIAGDTFIVGAR